MVTHQRHVTAAVRCEAAATQAVSCVSVEPLDSDQLMEVSYNAVRGSLSIVPRVTPPGAPCFLVFDGVGLTEDGLKDWLRLCAKQVDVHHAERR